MACESMSLKTKQSKTAHLWEYAELLEGNMPARDICGAIVEEWKDARMWRAMWTLLQNLDINA